MARSLFPYAFIQEFDNNGKPLAGGTITFYKNDQAYTTLKETYVSSSGSANANPVVLDYSGRAQIWLDGTYDCVLKDANGVTIATRNNISGLGGGSSGTTANLYKVATMVALKALSVAAMIDGDIIYLGGYYDTLGGGGWFVWDSDSTSTDDGGTIIWPDSHPAKGRWIRYKNDSYNSLDVRCFGAKGDGTTNDAAAFILGRSWAAQGTGNRNLIISEGTYLLNSDPLLSITSCIFMPFGVLSWTAEATLTVRAIIDPSDYTRHFITTSYNSNVIVLDGTSVVRPEHFGYHTDKTDDDNTIYFKQALRACANGTNTSNRKIELLNRTYTVNTEIELPDGAILDGHGATITVALVETAEGNGILLNPTSQLINCSVVVTGTYSGATTYAGVKVLGVTAGTSCKFAKIENVSVNTKGTAMLHGIRLGDAGGTLVCHNAQIINVSVTADKYGIYLENAQRCRIIGGDIYSCTWSGIRVGLNASAVSSDNVIENVFIKKCNTGADATDKYKMSGIYNDAPYTTIKNCQFSYTGATETQKYSVCNVDTTGTLILENLHTYELAASGTAYFGDTSATVVRTVDSCTDGSGETRTNMTFTVTAGTVTAANIIPTTDIYTVAYTESTSFAITNLSGAVGEMYYHKVGKLVFVSVYASGTYASGTVSFTLPYKTKDNTFSQNIYHWCRAVTNGVTSSGIVVLSENSTSAAVYSTVANASWTAGICTFWSMFWYEADA
jgi:hypothetical protein